MPRPDFVQKKRDERKKQQQWLCRPGGHYTSRTRIVVDYAPRVGLCGSCLLRYAGLMADGQLNLPSYWLRDWPKEAQIRVRGDGTIVASPIVDKEESSERKTRAPVLV